MKTRLLTVTVLSIVAACSAAAQDSTTRQAAAKACEDEVEQTVKRMREGAAQQVQFIGSKRVLAELSADETGIHGEGRWRNRAGAFTPFSYSCTYNAGNNTTSGVLFRESAGSVATAPSSARRDAAAVGDGAIASTDVCESAVAQALHDKHPRVGRIVFGSDTRRLAPAPESRTTMEGEGAVQRAPGMSQVRFSYRCVFDPRSGRVDRVTTSE